MITYCYIFKKDYILYISLFFIALLDSYCALQALGEYLENQTFLVFQIIIIINVVK